MPSQRKRMSITPGGPLKEVEWVEIESSKEPWSEYRLSDGTIVRQKTVVAEVWRVVGEYDGEGNPQYIIKSGAMMNVQSPDELKRQPS